MQAWAGLVQLEASLLGVHTLSSLHVLTWLSLRVCLCPDLSKGHQSCWIRTYHSDLVLPESPVSRSYYQMQSHSKVQT